jgi:hypothetical protein
MRLIREVETCRGVSFPFSSLWERVKYWANVSSDLGSPRRKEEQGEEFRRLVESEAKRGAVHDEAVKPVDVFLG